MVARKNEDWQERLDYIVATMREMSRQTDPQAMVAAYVARVREILPSDRMLSLSRRDLPPPRYRITRSSTWDQPINPWKEPHRLPLLEGGLLAELIYGDEPRILDDLHVARDDPARDYLEGMGSLMALPLYDRGVAANMVVVLRKAPAAFDREDLPERVWMSNLFGRATTNLVLSEELREAYQEVDHELKVIADIQRGLLPSVLPKIATMDLATYYQTSRRAGGDYYDFFPLPDGRWGILIADVSGHGTPAAVMMAITHSIAHTFPGPPCPPGRLLAYLNDQLAGRYTSNSGTFVTAFYGIYDPVSRELVYACAGHNPPRLKHCDDGTLTSLEGSANFPLGIVAGTLYEESRIHLRRGDQIILYTDGITEATNPAGAMFGTDRLDAVLESCRPGAEQLINAVLEALAEFTAGQPAEDDRTLLVAKIT